MVQFTKLRLSGFKSFIDPTELLIERGVTGIVGPNGCGKSNLVEALRWAMGETSAKSMRGGEMEDVIFAGSATRPSRNIAEVALALDNAERNAPAALNDGEELEVVRRIERGRGSQYRVNGREVRARDVQLLFADSATGAHSTALVSQGRIGALINAKPTSRRALLEEAAGITGLHSRRHEAELRLRAAETNLERLDDVIATLESQLQGLKKQARQATRYRNLAGHIRRQESILLHLEHQRATAALNSARDALTASQSRVAALTQAAAAASTEQAAAAAALPELRHREAAAAAALQSVLVERDNLDREEAQVIAAQSRVQQTLKTIDDDQARSHELAGDAEAALARLAAERETLSAAAENEVETRTLAKTQYDDLAAQVAAREDEVDELGGRIATDEAEAMTLDRRIAELSERLGRLRDQAARHDQERAELEAARAADQDMHEAEAESAAAEEALTGAREAAGQAAEALSAAREEEQRARDALREAEASQSKLDAEIAALGKLLESPQGDIWPPIIDTLAVEAGLERALGAALGDDLDASADNAAPVHWEALPPYDAPRALPAGAEPMDRFVAGSDALNRRLGQIGLVPDEATGARLQAELAPGQRLVTRDGALWRWDGLAARAEAPTAAATRLAQRNRLAELRERLPARARETALLAETHGAVKTKAEDAAIVERDARAALDTAFGRAAAARERRGELAQQAAALTSRLSSLEESGERLGGDIAEAEASLAAGRDDRAALPDLASCRTRLSELRAQLAEWRGTLARAQGDLERLDQEARSRGARLEAIGEESGSWERRAKQAAEHLGELATRREGALDELATLEAQPAEIATRREALAAEIETAEALRKAAADTLAEGETRLAEADRKLKGEEQNLAQSREERVRHQAETEHCEETLTGLVGKVRERLDCPVDGLLEVAEIDPGQDLPGYEEVEAKLARLQRERDNMGPVNLRADQEAAELDQQIVGMQGERADLVSAIAKLRQGINSLNREGRQRLLTAFEEVNRHFSELFVRLFGGGRAHLALTEADDPLEAGLEIMASPPGKRLQVLSLLSGGEQALTALALLFAVFLTNPAPICVLDEVDAPLDDANVDRFCTLVEQLAAEGSTRFLLITHHRMTMARVDRLYGVTMAERGVSQLVSVDLDAAEELRETA